MTYLSELFSHVISSLMRNKLRSFLTMAGIAWGVASIVLIVAMGDGFQQGQRKSTKQLGENIVIVFPGRTEKQAGGQRAGRRIRYTYQDVEDIRRECYLIQRAVVEMRVPARAASPFNSGSFTVMGVETHYPSVRTMPVWEGRFFSRAENAEARRVCVLGNNVRKQLFASRQGILNTEIKLNGLPYQVIGLMPDKTQNSSYDGMDVDKIFVPYESMVRDIPMKDPTWAPGIISNFVYVPASLDDFAGAQKQVRRVLARNHRFEPDDESATPMWDTVENAKMVDGIFQSMTVFLATIALVTLTLGGVGVMNIMLVAVTERTPEIGLRKALGATRRRILVDFLAEGVLLAVVSGTAGWLVSWTLAAVVNSFPMPDMFSGLPVKPHTTIAAFLALGVIAVGSAAFPAWRAANLTPVEALRYER